MAEGYELAKAYVQIIPTTEGIKDNLTAALSGDAEKAADEAGKKGGSKFSSAFGTAAKAVMATTAAITGAVAGVTSAFISGVSGVAEYGDEIDKTSQKVGVSAEEYQALAFAAEHCGFETSVLQTAAKSLAQTDFSGNLTDALNTVMSLGTEEERTAMATELFGARAAQQMAALLNGSETMEDYTNQLAELGGIMSNDSVKSAAAFQDSLLNLQTAFGGLKTQMLSEFLPACTDVMDGITKIFTGNPEEGLEQIGEGVKSIVDTISDLMPEILKMGGQIVISLAEAVVQNFPVLLDAALNVVKMLSTSIPTILPTLLEAVINLIVQVFSNLESILEPIIAMLPDIIMMIMTALTNNIDAIISGIVNCVIMIVGYLPEIVSAIIDYVPDFIIALVAAIIKCIPQLIVAVGECIGSILQTIVGKTPDLLSKVGQLGSQMIQGLRSALSSIGQVGLNLVQGLWNGISDATSWVLDKIKGFGASILDGIKSIFGIHSPSKATAEYGRFIDMGLAEGITDNIGLIEDAVEEMASPLDSTFSVVSEVGGTGSGASYGGIVVNVYGSDGQSEETLADAVINKLQRVINGRSAIYA